MTCGPKEHYEQELKGAAETWPYDASSGRYHLESRIAILCSRDACSVAARRGGFRAHDRRSARCVTGLNTPVGDYVDPKGNLYVANEGTCAGTGNVVEYAHGSASPTYTYSAGLNCPLYAVADANGHVFVYDYAGALTSNVVEYKQKTNTVLATWNTCNTGTYAFCYPTGLTIDASGHVFATLYGAVHGSLSYYWTVDDVYYKLKNVQAYVTGYTGPAGGVAVDKHRNILVSANSVPSSGSAGKGAALPVRRQRQRPGRPQLLRLHVRQRAGAICRSEVALRGRLRRRDADRADVSQRQLCDGARYRQRPNGSGRSRPRAVSLGPHGRRRLGYMSEAASRSFSCCS